MVHVLTASAPQSNHMDVTMGLGPAAVSFSIAKMPTTCHQSPTRTLPDVLYQHLDVSMEQHKKAQHDSSLSCYTYQVMEWLETGVAVITALEMRIIPSEGDKIGGVVNFATV